MKSLWIGALVLGLMPMTAMAGGHSSFSFSFGLGSWGHSSGWSLGVSSGRSYHGHRYTGVSVRVAPAPVYVAPRPVYVRPRVIQPSVPVYVPPPTYCPPAYTPSPVIVQPRPVYVAPPVVVQPSPVYVPVPSYGPVVQFNYRSGGRYGGHSASHRYGSHKYDSHKGHGSYTSHGRYNYGGGGRYSYHR